MNNSTISETFAIASLVDQLNLYLKNVDFNFLMIMIIFPVGLLLNGLQLFVFSRRELNSKTNMGSMHALLSFFNILAIFFSILLTQLLPFLGIYIKNSSVFGCKFLSFLQRVSLDIPSFQGTLKFKIKNHRISTESEFSGSKLKLFGKKTWSNLGANCDLSNITGCPIWL